MRAALFYGSLVFGSLRQFRLNGLQIHQGFLQVRSKQVFLFETGKGFHQFSGNFLYFHHLCRNLGLFLGSGAGQLQLPFSQVHQLFMHFLDGFHRGGSSGLIRHLVHCGGDFLHAGHALLGQGSMGILGKCRRRDAGCRAQADESNCVIHGMEAFPL